MPRRQTREQFIERASKIHNNKYDYSKVEYINDRTLVTIVCPKHGDFSQMPCNHTHPKNPTGCPKCKADKQRRLLFGVGVNNSVDKVMGTRAYNVWVGMLRRCYDTKSFVKHPTYKGCVVCDEWLDFLSFKQWFDIYDRDGYAIDKDIIKKGNKVYCPEYCCMVPQEINSLLTGNDVRRGEYPIGVSYYKRYGNYTVHINLHGKRVTLGYYNTPEDAFYAYKKVKEAYIKEVAQDYFDKGLITERVRDALFYYKIEITD